MRHPLASLAIALLLCSATPLSAQRARPSSPATLPLATVTITPHVPLGAMLEVRTGERSDRGTLERISGDTLFLRNYNITEPFAITPNLSVFIAGKRRHGFRTAAAGVIIGGLIGAAAGSGVSEILSLASGGNVDVDLRVVGGLLFGGLLGVTFYNLSEYEWHPVTIESALRSSPG